MEKTVEIRNLLIEKLKETYGAMAVVPLNGHYLAGADVAINGENGAPEVYRITVIKHEPQNSPR